MDILQLIDRLEELFNESKSIPLTRNVMVDLNLDELYAKQLSPVDVSNALNQQNLILPAGTAKLASTSRPIESPCAPATPCSLSATSAMERKWGADSPSQLAASA